MGADGGDGFGLGEAFGVGDGEVLDASVGVVDHAGGVLALADAGPQGVFERVDRQVGAHRGRGSPADDAAGVEVADEGDEVEPATCGHVRDVGDPPLVRCCRGEVTLEQVGAGVGLPVACRDRSS